MAVFGAKSTALTAEHKENNALLQVGDRIVQAQSAGCAARFVPGDLAPAAIGSFPGSFPGKIKNLLEEVKYAGE